jgi:glycerol uptake facilitator protein
MQLFLFECIGTAIIILLGNGVVSNVLLQHTKGYNSGWLVITFGWAIAVFSGVLVAAPHSGAHLNPAVSIAMAVTGNVSWEQIPVYLAGQFSGAMVGQIFVWLAYKQHFDATSDSDAIRACFCNTPALRNHRHNLTTEIIGTFVLVITILFMVAPTHSLGALDALPVALVVLGIGLSLGGPTGYAINPARDLGPRIMHSLLPIQHKANSDWAYGWVPVIGPVAGGLLASVVYMLLKNLIN